MDVYDVLPLIAAAGFAISAILIVTGVRVGWIAPAALSVGFLAWSLFAIGSEGPFGFWAEHTRNAWGNQIWFDLLMGVGLALALLVPQARRVGVRPLGWVVLTAATGSIGLFAFAARVFYVQSMSDMADRG